MGKYPIYAILALVFIGIMKLLQVTVFDSEQYVKSKKESFSKLFKETATAYKKETQEVAKDSTFIAKESAYENSELESPEETPINQNSSETSEGSGFDSLRSVEEKIPATYTGLNDLKNNYLKPKIDNLPPGQLREDVVIRYYRHGQDGDNVFRLKDLGYYIHEKEATETVGLGSNVLYYGEDVNVEDIQIVAYILLEGGLPLKSIEPTQYSWKSNAIEIGTDTLLLNKAAISGDDIKNFNKL